MMANIVMSKEAERDLAFYRYENDNVLIDRILHGRQDYISILLGNVVEEDE